MALKTRVHVILFVVAISFKCCYNQLVPDQDCQTYPDTLVFGLDYPGGLETSVQSCADTRRLKLHLDRVLNIKFNTTIVKTAQGKPKYEDTILLLTPRSTQPFHQEELPPVYRFSASGRIEDKKMHIVKSTIVGNAIWDRKDQFHKFSEIIYEDDEETECQNDFDPVFRIFDAKHIYNKEFNTEDPKDLKVIIIPILKHTPVCLRVGLVNDKKIDDLSTLNDAYRNNFKTPANVTINPYLTSSVLYQTNIEAVYPNFERILNLDTSAAPWLDKEFLEKNSSWCRSHRHILAFSELVFEFSVDGQKVLMEATERYYCSLQVLGDRRLIYMPFPAFGFSIVFGIKMVSTHVWYLESVYIRRTSDKKQFNIRFGDTKMDRYQTRYSEPDTFAEWNKLAPPSCSRPHVRYGNVALVERIVSVLLPENRPNSAVSDVEFRQRCDVRSVQYEVENLKVLHYSGLVDSFRYWDDSALVLRKK